MLARPDDGRPVRSKASSWADIGGETLISLTKDYPYEQLTQKQLEKMGVVCKRGQTVNGLDTQLGLVEAGLGVAVIPSFGVMASRNRKVRVTRLEPEVTLDFYEISNRGRRLPPEATEFAGFLKTFLARRVGEYE
jgi:DNA-binding transcriptional LysR family regulator